MAKLTTDRSKGLLIMMTGVLLVSPDAVVTRFLSEGGAHPWTIIFWKMIFVAQVALGFAMYDAGGPSKMWKQISDGIRYYPYVVPLNAFVDTCFTLSFVYTSAANALLLINLNPLWCALAGKFLLGDVLPARTYVALALALGCIMIIFVPELIGQHNANTTDSVVDEEVAIELGDSRPLGNVLALFTGLGLAAYITLVRHAGTRETPVILIASTIFSSMLAAGVALVVRLGDVLPSSYWRIGEDDTQVWQFWLASLAQGAGVGAIFISFTIAPRLITGAEVGLTVLLESILGPFFVYLAYGDVPSRWTILGGTILLIVLAIHEAAPLLVMAHHSISRRITELRSSTILESKRLEESSLEEMTEQKSANSITGESSEKVVTKDVENPTFVPKEESE